MRARALQLADELEAEPPPGPARPGGRRDDRAAALAGRRPLHLPRLPRVRAPDRARATRTTGWSPCPAPGWASCAPTRRRPRDAGRLPPEAHATALGRSSCCVITKANSPRDRAPPGLPRLHRRQDVRRRRRGGRRAALPRPVHLGGLHARASSDIPVLRRKVAEVLDRSGLRQRQPLRQGPAADPGDLPARRAVPDRHRRPRTTTALGVLHLQERRQLRLFLRRDEYGRFISCLVYLPRDRYTTAGPAARWRRSCSRASTASSVDYTTRVSESVLARLHFVVRVDPSNGVPDVDPAEVEARLVARDPDLGRRLRRRAARTAAATEQAPGSLQRLRRRVPRGATRRTCRPPTAVADLHRLEALGARRRHRPAALRRRPAPRPATARFKVFHVGEPISLSPVLPLLQSWASRSSTSGRTRSSAPGAPRAWVYDFGLRYRAVAASCPSDDARDLFEDAFAAVWRGEAESRRLQRAGAAGRADLAAGVVLRAYAKYLRQAGIDVQPGLHRGVPASPTRRSPRLLVALFEARFDPTLRARPTSGAQSGRRRWSRRSPARSTRWPASTRTASCARSSALIQATLRTSYFQRRRRRPAQAVRRVQARPAARSPTCRRRGRSSRSGSTRPRVEGVHLRFGAGRPRRAALVGPARGLPHRGARPGQGADGEERGHRAGRRQGRLRRQAAAGRPDRPRGAAGRGRRLLPDVHQRPARRHRQPGRSTAAQVVPPPQVVRHDGDDPYLVVAADKGTATFSDIANEIVAATTASGSATRSPPAARPATTTRRWASPPAARGSR